MESGYIIFPIGKSSFGKISTIDGDLLAHSWQMMKSGYVFVHRNVNTAFDSHSYLHRAIMEKSLGRKLIKGECVDHINHDRSDNRRENLRLATWSQNQGHARLARDSKSGYKGVYYSNDRKRVKKWCASITVNSESIYIGRYHSAIEAAEAYNQAAIKYFGGFAQLNVIPPQSDVTEYQ